MRKLIYILFLLPFAGYAQFNLQVQAINIEDQSNIANAQVSLGDARATTEYNNARMGHIDVSNLGDTLFIDHRNFKFDAKPLLDNEYSVEGNTIHLRIYGRPWKRNEINIDLNIAKSKKVKNDTVRIDWSHAGSNSIISFEPAIETKKNKSIGRDPFTHAYDDLMDGNFIISTNHTVKKVPFRKENWTQLVCLNLPVPMTSNERELNILTQYFQQIEDAKQQLELLEYQHQREIDSLQGEIDDLEREIDRLNGIPIAYRPIYPVPVEEYVVEEVYFFVNDDARPAEGYDAFTANLRAALGDMTTKYSGNITIEINVQKDGKVRAKVLHASKDKQDVVLRLKHHLNKQRWEPASSSGRILESSTILNIKISASK